jgi:hypothetical protein
VATTFRWLAPDGTEVARAVRSAAVCREPGTPRSAPTTPAAAAAMGGA